MALSGHADAAASNDLNRTSLLVPRADTSAVWSLLAFTGAREKESPAKAGLVPLGRQNLLRGKLLIAIDGR
jgi:hypothetical protein